MMLEICYTLQYVIGILELWANSLYGNDLTKLWAWTSDFRVKLSLEGNHALESEVHINSDRIEKGVHKEMMWWKQGYPANFTEIFSVEV